MYKSQTFCAIPKDDFHLVNLVFVQAQICVGTNFFEQALNAIKFLDWLKKFEPAHKTFWDL
jgi:hypothetical protein